jgi:hypothetical protein
MRLEANCLGERANANVAFGADSDFLAALAHVRYSAHSGRPGTLPPCLKSANNGH